VVLEGIADFLNKK